MRAARLLEMLLLLQRRGPMTTRQLAEALEVSQRSVLRDVEALSGAGVPIFATRGFGGGIELMDGFQTKLTGLTADEAGCLLLVGQPLVAHRLGLGVPTATARTKLLSALPPRLATDADHLSMWFHHDPDPWTGNRIPHGELRRLAHNIRLGRIVEISIADNPPAAVKPLGLVLKAGSWQLIVSDPDEIRVVCIDDLRATRLTRQHFASPPGFDLAMFWDRARRERVRVDAGASDRM